MWRKGSDKQDLWQKLTSKCAQVVSQPHGAISCDGREIYLGHIISDSLFFNNSQLPRAISTGVIKYIDVS